MSLVYWFLGLSVINFFSKNNNMKKTNGPRIPNVNIIEPTVINFSGIRAIITPVFIKLERFKYKLALKNLLAAKRELMP